MAKRNGASEPAVSALQDIAGVAQLVERNLAKVEVASSRLVSRSSQRGSQASLFVW
ncbi:protein of unknown function [Caballeronia sp. S22]